MLCVVLGKGVSLSLYYPAALPQGKTGPGQDKLIFIWIVSLRLSPGIAFEVPVLCDQKARDAESVSSAAISGTVYNTDGTRDYGDTI